MALSMTLPSHVIKGIYALTPDSTDTAVLLHRARQALSGGVKVLQYRNKIAAGPLKLEQARLLRELTREFGATLIVNDDAQLASAVDADGVHLGAADVMVQTARSILGRKKLIGVSCYNRLQLARAAEQSGADYVAFGAFFSSTVKPEAVVATMDLLREARSEIKVPIVAIGGITAENGAELVRQGADALAVISSLFDATDIQKAAQELNKIFSK